MGETLVNGDTIAELIPESDQSIVKQPDLDQKESVKQEGPVGWPLNLCDEHGALKPEIAKKWTEILRYISICKGRSTPRAG